MRRALVALVTAWALGACGKSAPDDQAPAPTGSDRPELVTAAEIARGKDACAGYLEKVCACAKTVPAVAETCALARGGPEAIRVALEVSMSTDSTRKDVIDAQKTVRKIVKACVEDTAKLPALGCPP